MRAAIVLMFGVAVTASGCYRAHALGEAGLEDVSGRDGGGLRPDTFFEGIDVGPFVGECRTPSDCPAPVASCATAVCLGATCSVAEISGACPSDSLCDLTRGCVPNPTFRDSGPPDPMPDAGFPDAFITDAGMPDAFAVDAGPPPVGSAIRCTEETVLRVPNHTQLDFGPTATIELWLRARAPGTIAIKGPLTSGHVFHLRIEGDGAGAMLIGGWGTRTTERTVTAPFGDHMGVWTHVALVQEDRGDTVLLSFLLDGVVVSTASVTNDFGDAANSLDFRLCTLDADMDEIRLWRVVREPSSIIADLRRPLPSGIVGLSAYWPLDGRGQVVLDRSLHGAEGVLGETTDVERADPLRITDGAF